MRRRAALIIVVTAVAALAACDKMANQHKQLPYEVSGAQTGNPDPIPPDGVVARDAVPAPPPPPVTPALLKRGQQRFDVYCAVCHGRTGVGNGMVVQRGFPKPPSYLSGRLMAAPSQHFYDVISNGYGAMYAYADRVAPADRWAIVAYIRALQLSQHATLNDVPPAMRDQVR